MNTALIYFTVPFFFRVSIKETSVSKLGSVCRRVYRIFSHAYFHHRTIFDEFEVSFQFTYFLPYVHNCLTIKLCTYCVLYVLLSESNFPVQKVHCVCDQIQSDVQRQSYCTYSWRGSWNWRIWSLMNCVNNLTELIFLTHACVLKILIMLLLHFWDDLSFILTISTWWKMKLFKVPCRKMLFQCHVCKSNLLP